MRELGCSLVTTRAAKDHPDPRTDPGVDAQREMPSVQLAAEAFLAGELSLNLL